MEVKRKMHELKSADVRFISLVTRAANRIPFRVVKQEQDMSIDLSGRYARSIKKAEVVTPGIAGIVVFKQEDAAKMEAVEAVLKGAGFAVDAIEDNEDGTRIYKQGDVPADASVIRLSDNMALVVKGFAKQAEVMAEAAQFSEAIPAEGFFQGPVVASEAYQAEMLGMVKKGDTAGMEEVTKQYHNYMGAMTSVIPAVAFKADLEIAEALQSVAAPAELPNNDGVAPVAKEEDDEAKAAAAAQAVSADAPVDAPAAEAVEPVAKSDEAKPEEGDKVEALLAGLKDSILSLKSEMTEQMKNFRAELDNVARKQDDANTQVTTTVMAVAKGDKEAPAVVQKQEDTDPRTGCFDTAMMRRNRR